MEKMVVKANDLIMARYDLTLTEQRLIIEVISKINPRETSFKDVYRVPVKDYLDLAETSAKNEYDRLHIIAKKIVDKSLSIPREHGGFLVASWFADVEYIPGEGVLEISVSKKLRPYLLELKRRFTSYQLENVLKLKSKYTVRLYEILKSKAYQKEWVVEVEELKELLAIPVKYTWGHIRLRILKEAEKTLKSTDIQFGFCPLKRGRKVVAVRFEIVDTGQQALELGQPDPAPVSVVDTQPTTPPGARDKSAPAQVDEAEIDALLKLVPGRSRRAATKLIREAVAEYGAEYVRQKIELAAIANITKNYAGWLRQAIHDDYQPPAAADPAKRQREAREAAEREMQLRVEANQDLIDELTGRIIAPPTAPDDKDQIISIQPRPGGGWELTLRSLATRQSRVAQVNDLGKLRMMIVT